MIQSILRLFAAIFILLIFNQLLHAEEKPIGSVVALRGMVTAVNAAGGPRRLAIQSEIYLSDTIKTGRRGRVQMMFDDNTLISLGTNTDMQIAAYQWDPDKKTGAMKTRVQEGVFRIMGGAITQAAPDNFKTETPAGTIGIRGSMYAGKVSGSALRLLFQGGKGIYVSNRAGTVNIDRPGFGTFVAGPSAPPAKPTRMTGEVLTQLDHVALDAAVNPDDDSATDPGSESEVPADSSSEVADDSVGDPDTASEVPADSSSEVADDSVGDPDTASEVPADSSSEAAADSVGDPDTASEVPADSSSEAADDSVGDPDTASEVPADSDGEPGAADDQQSLQDLAVVEAFDEPAPGEESPPVADSQTSGSLQSSALTSPVDTIKNEATQIVVDSIETVRQDKVIEIEQAILDLLLELGFTGDRSLNTPNNGIETFDGELRHKPVDSQEVYSKDPVKMVINWHSQKFFGVVGDQTQPDKPFPVFIFGDVQNTALDNITAVGGGLEPEGNRVATISGSGVFGQLYGTQTDATGFAMQGVDVEVQFQSNRLAWTAYGAAISNGEPSATDTVPGGTHSLKGFVMGIAEDMAAPHLNRRVFMNDASSQFGLTVNKDSGTIDGDLAATDFNLSGSTIAGLQIGGSLGSAYVLDDAMIALLGGTDCIKGVSSVGGLKPYGNYLVTEKLPDQLSPHTTWGYWEIAYKDPNSGTDYHVHHPISFWIAGPQTPASELNTLISDSVEGRYRGGAEGIQIESTGMITELTGGITDLTINFAPNASTPLSGNIRFDGGINLNVLKDPSVTDPITSGGFSGIITGADESTVKGTYFGPKAASIGGNFGAKMSTGEEYYGIFAGELQ